MLLVDRPRRLHDLAEALGRTPRIGVDTEADSFHAYREKTCLVQISTYDEDYLVDPLALPDLTPLRPAFSDPAIIKVFHAADNDVAALKRDFDLLTHGLFDTMVACRILGVPRFGLGDLLREHFGVESDKRMQRYTWGTRPLSAAAMHYAAMDSHFLVPLSQILQDRLRQTGHLDEAEEVFERLERSEATVRNFDPENFWRLKGAYDLDAHGRANLRELYVWRESRAERADSPPFRIISDSALVALAAANPASRQEIEQLEEVPLSLAHRYGDEMLAAIRRAAGVELPRPIRRVRKDEAVSERFEALRAWRRRLALERGVEPDVIVSNAVLSALANRMPRTEAELRALDLLGPWKLATYGPSLLTTLKTIGG